MARCAWKLFIKEISGQRPNNFYYKFLPAGQSMNRVCLAGADVAGQRPYKRKTNYPKGQQVYSSVKMSLAPETTGARPYSVTINY